MPSESGLEILGGCYLIPPDFADGFLRWFRRMTRRQDLLSTIREYQPWFPWRVWSYITTRRFRFWYVYHTTRIVSRRAGVRPRKAARA